MKYYLYYCSPAIAVTALLTYLLCMSISILEMEKVQTKNDALKEELVNKGYAEYVVIDNKTGKTEFKLK